LEVLDLDTLRPQKRILKLAGNEIDVSFIPCAITWDVDKLINEINALNKDEVLDGKEETRKAFDLSIKLCSLFCEHKYPEMNEAWFRENADPIQIKYFVNAIRGALNKAYEGIEANPKN
jgi:hypothetical protein